MKEITTTITQRSQVTVPAEVRRVLGVKPRDKITFTIADGDEYQAGGVTVRVIRARASDAERGDT